MTLGVVRGDDHKVQDDDSMDIQAEHISTPKRKVGFLKRITALKPPHDHAIPVFHFRHRWQGPHR